MAEIILEWTKLQIPASFKNLLTRNLKNSALVGVARGFSAYTSEPIPLVH